MTSTLNHHPLVRPTSPLLRRVGGIELPAIGRWTVPDNHATIAFSTKRFLRRRDTHVARGLGATIHMGDDPAEVSVRVTFEDPGRDIIGLRGGTGASPVNLEASAVATAKGWVMSGSVYDEFQVAGVSADLRYRGVWSGGRGDQPYAWFVLAGVIASRRAIKHQPLQFSFDLLAYKEPQ